jgi:hypothetical protein
MAEINELGAMLGLLQQGYTPEQARAQMDEAKAMQMAKMSGREMTKMGLIRGGNALRQGLMSAMGADVQDPVAKTASQVRQLGSQFDTNTAEGMMQFARALAPINQQLSAQAAANARKMLQDEATLGKTRADMKRTTALAAQEEEQLKREQKLQEELSKLPDNATEAQLLGVYRRFGDAKQVAASIERAQNLKAQIDARAAEAEAKARIKLEADTERARTQAERDKAQREHQIELERIRQEGRQFQTQLTASLKGADKPKETASDRARLEQARNIAIKTEGTLDKITEFENKINKGELTFGALGNLASTGRVAFGVSKQKDINLREFKKFTLAAANDLLLLAKGTQTEGDAQRARDQVVAALDTNDTKAVQSALAELKRVVGTTRKSAELTIQDYNDTFGTNKAVPGGTRPAPTAAAPAAPKATKRFNPATGQIEDIK